MLPQLKNISMDFSLVLDDDECPELTCIRFEPVSSSHSRSFRFVYDNGYDGPDDLWVLCHKPGEILMIDSEHNICCLNLKDCTEDISSDIVSSLAVDRATAGYIAVCLSPLLSVLSAIPDFECV